jgi:small subunit ribosomal protein S20
VPKIQSAKKRMRQSRKARERNRQQRAALRTALRKARAARGTDKAAEAARSAHALLDRGARKRLIHPNTAARLKSRLAKPGERK